MVKPSYEYSGFCGFGSAMPCPSSRIYLPHPMFISKWIAPLGNTVAEPGGRLFIMKRPPFSLRSPVRRVPLTEKLISVARGCVCGVLSAQGPNVPMAAIK